MEIVVIIMMRVTRLSCQKLFKVMTMIVGMAMTMFKGLFVKYSQKNIQGTTASPRIREQCGGKETVVHVSLLPERA